MQQAPNSGMLVSYQIKSLVESYLARGFIGCVRPAARCLSLVPTTSSAVGSNIAVIEKGISKKTGRNNVLHRLYLFIRVCVSRLSVHAQ